VSEKSRSLIVVSEAARRSASFSSFGRDSTIRRVSLAQRGERVARTARQDRLSRPFLLVETRGIEPLTPALHMPCVMPTRLFCAGRPAPTAGSPVWSACDRHIRGDRTGDSDPLICPVWIVSMAPMPLPHRSSVCWSHPNADGVVVAYVVPLVEGKRRELDRWDVCPGGPTSQGPGRGQIAHPEPVCGRRSRQSTTVEKPSWTTPVDNGTGCPHLRLDLVLDDGIEVDSPTGRRTPAVRPVVAGVLRGVRRQTRQVSGATRSSPVRSYWPLSSFWRRGQGWRLRQREAPPEAPLRPAPERGRSRPEGATAGSDGGAVLDAARPAPGRHDAGLSPSILELAERLHPGGATTCARA
jgi:hypothetical protein